MRFNNMKKSKKKVLKKTFTEKEVEQIGKTIYKQTLKNERAKQELTEKENKENIDIVEQFNNLKAELDIQIEKEQQRRSYGTIGWLLIHSTQLIQSLHNSLAKLTSEKKPQKKTQQKNLCTLRECVSNFREVSTLLGLGRNLGNLSFKYYINLLKDGDEEKTKDYWMKQEKHRQKIEKRILKSDIKISPLLRDERQDKEQE